MVNIRNKAGGPLCLCATDFLDFLSLRPAPEEYEEDSAANLAWWESYLLMGLVEVLEHTHSTEILRILKERVDAVLALRDPSSGLWRGGSPYVFSTSFLSIEELGTTVEMAVRGKRYTQWTASGKAQRFSLSLFGEREQTTLDGLSLLYQDERWIGRIFDESSGLNTGARILRRFGEPMKLDETFQKSGHFQDQHSFFSAHTALICRPIVKFAAFLLRENSLEGLFDYAQYLIGEAYETASRHNGEWQDVDLPIGPGGAYRFPAGRFVPFDRLIQPVNQNNLMGLLWLEILNTQPEDELARDRVEMLARSFYFDIELDESQRAVWPYWPTFSEIYSGFEEGETSSVSTVFHRSVRVAEDLSHGAIDVEFAARCYDAGVVFDEKAMRLLAQTMRQVFSGELPLSRVGGGGRFAGEREIVGIPAWAHLHPWYPEGPAVVQRMLLPLGADYQTAPRAFSILNCSQCPGPF